MQGKCQGCDSYGEVNDIMLCDACAEELEKEDGLSDDQVEDWTASRRASQKKRARNREFSTALIEKWCKDYSGMLMRFSESHLRINERFDFWPGTGKYQDRVTSQYRRGVFNLIKELDKHYNTQLV